jgi:AcrR family transcriptional regulator
MTTWYMSSIISLNDRHTDATRELILSTAIELLERSGVSELTVRAVAKQAGMSERTVFRYYATRDEFLDAAASEATRLMQPPAPPTTIRQLLNFPDPLYRCFEDRAPLVQAALHTEIFKRVRAEAAEKRWQAVAVLIDQHATNRSKKDRKIGATNINYYLSATTWHYYRSHFELSLEDTIACAKAALRLIVDDLVKA